MEDMALAPDFWAGRRVFITGHTGFKGAWLSAWLLRRGAIVTGFSLAPQAQAPLYAALRLEQRLTSHLEDIRAPEALTRCLRDSEAEVVFHLAAQAVVADGYLEPKATFDVNVGGTINLLEAIRNAKHVRAVVVATSDKCYRPNGGGALREDDPFGGNDPYSASKGCAEIATAAWRHSFFGSAEAPRIATARAGNVVGGGDMSAHRLIPDMVRAWTESQPLTLRMGLAIRPWQHVLDGLAGYMLLAERLVADDGTRFATGWNFGPDEKDHIPVAAVVERCARYWGNGAIFRSVANFQSETEALRLDSTAARKHLGWKPRWPIDVTLRHTLDWYKTWANEGGRALESLSETQISIYETT